MLGPLLYDDPYIAKRPSFFKICPTHLAPPPPPPDTSCAVLLNDNMDLHMSSLGNLVPDLMCVLGPKVLHVCFMQQGVKFTEVWHMWFFNWYSDLKSHTQTHTAYSAASRLTHPYKYTFTPPVMCSQQLPLLN